MSVSRSFGWVWMLVFLLVSGGCAGGSVSNANQGAKPGTGFVVKNLGGSESGRKYGVFVPHNYDGARAYPVILFLHGAFEGGGDPAKAFSVGLGPVIAEQASTFDFIAVVPQTRGNWGEDTRDLADAYQALQEVKRDYRVDGSRISLTGLSIGGYGVWALAEKHPNEFAALVPMCGYDKLDAVPKIKGIPIWIFHNNMDPFVSVGDSKAMERELKNQGADVRLTVYTAFGHDVWVRAYREDALWQWLRQQRRDDRPTSYIP